jgi:hypothetical protein
MSAEKSRSRSAVAQPPDPVAAQVDQVEPARCVQRVAHRIEAAFQRHALRTHDLATAVVRRGKALPVDLQWLTDHWSMPINGPTASAAILTRLASSASLPDRGSRPDVAGEPFRANSNGNEPAPVIVEPSHKQPRQISASSAVHQSRIAKHSQQLAPWDKHVSQPWSSQADDTAETVASRIFSEPPLPQTGAAEQWSSLAPASAQAVPLLTPANAPAIAPPSLTPSLPPLHSHQQDDSILPIAAATAQRQARFAEEIAHGEDLTLLAERIERILKQEARRHGIDV